MGVPAGTVSIIAEAGRWSPSTRYRALRHVPGLAESFARVSLALPRDPVTRSDGRLAQAAYFGTHALRYTEQGMRVAQRLAHADAALVQRGLYVLGPATVLHALDGFDGPLVYDLDDAVFTPNPDLALRGAATRWLYGGRQSRALLRRADAVVVSTRQLAEMLPDAVTDVTVLPTVPDVAAHRPVIHAEGGPVVVGWVGTVGGVSFLDPLADAFRRLADEGLIRVEVVSSAPWSGPADFRRWELAEETSLFERFGIGIMPLPRSDYTRAKAGFKLLQYMASGLPVVASPVGINAELVERSGAGLLADTPDEWEAALRRLATDAALRTELGARGRRFVEAYEGDEPQARVLARLMGVSPPVL